MFIGQGRQTGNPVAAYVPAEHRTHVVLSAEGALPIGHSEQLLAPEVATTCPGGQVRHGDVYVVVRYPGDGVSLILVPYTLAKFVETEYVPGEQITVLFVDGRAPGLPWKEYVVDTHPYPAGQVALHIDEPFGENLLATPLGVLLELVP